MLIRPTSIFDESFDHKKYNLDKYGITYKHRKIIIIPPIVTDSDFTSRGKLVLINFSTSENPDGTTRHSRNLYIFTFECRNGDVKQALETNTIECIYSMPTSYDSYGEHIKELGCNLEAFNFYGDISSYNPELLNANIDSDELSEEIKPVDPRYFTRRQMYDDEEDNIEDTEENRRTIFRYEDISDNASVFIAENLHKNDVVKGNPGEILFNKYEECAALTQIISLNMLVLNQVSCINSYTFIYDENKKGYITKVLSNETEVVERTKYYIGSILKNFYKNVRKFDEKYGIKSFICLVTEFNVSVSIKYNDDTVYFHSFDLDEIINAFEFSLNHKDLEERLAERYDIALPYYKRMDLADF